MAGPIDSVVRGLVLKYGWNTTCFQILNKGIEQWVAADQSAVVGFVRRSGIRVVAGAPVCAESDLEKTLSDWERSEPSRVCYFGAEERLYSHLRDNPDYSTVVMGAQPVWTPETWARSIQDTKSLRYQIRRATNKGVTVSEWSPARVLDNSGLRRCLDYWLKTRGLPPLHFLVEPEILSEPEGRRTFVMEAGSEPVGFVVLAPIPARNGWLTEMFVRGRGAPNGAIEMALTEAIATVGREGATLVTMGMVPLSPHAQSEMDENPGWLRFLSSWSRAHLRRFYDFDGLDFFKSKFRPDDWEPIHVISNDKTFRLRTLYAITSAFTQANPLVTLGRGLTKAVQTEAVWAGRKLRRS